MTAQVCKPPALSSTNVRRTLNGALGAELSPALDACRTNPSPGNATLNASNLATPFAAATVVIPCRVAPEGFANSATVTSAAASVTTLPNASSIATWTAGSNGT